MHQTDARGSVLQHFKKQPARIVSLVPSQTELLYDLGLESETTGITKFCVHPAHWLRNKTRVGGTKNLNLEAIKKLAPDLVLANKEENVKEQIEALATHFPVWVTDVCNLDAALEMIEDIGMLTGKQAKAALLKHAVSNAFADLSKCEKIKIFRTTYLIWQDPYLTVGGDTFINAMLEEAGFENIFADQKRYPEVRVDMLREAGCELLLLSSEPYPFAEKHVPPFQALLPRTKIMLVDGGLFSWYGSRLLLAPAYFKNLQAQLRNLK